MCWFCLSFLVERVCVFVLDLLFCVFSCKRGLFAPDFVVYLGTIDRAECGKKVFLDWEGLLRVLRV
jgi:hypothetical protein